MGEKCFPCMPYNTGCAAAPCMQVSEDPPTIQLLFEHQNTDQQRGKCKSLRS